MIDILLAPLRAAANRLGSIGGMILTIVLVSYATYGLTPGGDLLRNLTRLALLAIVLICMSARHADIRGQNAMRALIRRKCPQPDQTDIDAALWMGCPVGADVETIKAAARTRMKQGHSDTGSGDTQMNVLVEIRDLMIERAKKRPAPPTPHELLTEWRRSAGFAGQLWGAILPSKILLFVREQSRSSLWPRLRKFILIPG